MSQDDFVGDEPTSAFRLPRLYNVIYCSRSLVGTDKADVDRIVTLAQRRNSVAGITGLLVFGSGIFFQWLEGPREQVTQLMSNIKRDARHDTVVALSESEEVRERLFPDWSMELVAADDIRAVLEDALGTADDEITVNALHLLRQHLDKSGVGT